VRDSRCPGARASGLYYWELARPWTEAVLGALRTTTDSRIRELTQQVMAEEAPELEISLGSVFEELPA